ncbi:MAG: sugar phosphate isomerase/epimerase [Planctomycetes bacterium]|nr:sugar phosphate isomerase/epimerase [Planctomycetota bacterium]
MKPVAVQLYTVREACAEDFIGTLKKIADIGYKGVEFAGLHGCKPEEIAKVVADLGMTACSSHIGLPTAETVNEIVQQEQTLGNKRVISGIGGDNMKTEDGCKRAAGMLNAAAELVEPFGMEIGYHNHWWEFDPKIDGRTPHEIMFAHVADNVFAELDVYWVATGDSDPVQVISSMSDRVPLLHIKDGPLVKGQPHTAVGAGVLDMHAIMAAADPNVLEWVIVELDDCATDMMEAVEQSYKYLTSERLAEGNK